MKHTFECHSSTPNFKYTCGISGCTQSLRTHSAILSHIQRKHRDVDVAEVSEVSGSQQQEELSVLDFNDTDDFQEQTASGASTSNNVSLAQRSIALLLLTLKERYRLTQLALDFCVGQIKEALHNILNEVKASVKRRTGEADIDDCFDIDPFEGLNTEYLQTKFYQQHFNLVVSYKVYQLCVSS